MNTSTSSLTENIPKGVYMTAGANKFLRIYYGKVGDHLAALVTSTGDNSSAIPQ